MEPVKQCIACPVEVRGLYAVAFNLLNLYKNADADPDRLKRKLTERLQELQSAVDKLKPHIDAHFEDRAHWQSEPNAAAKEPSP